MRFSRPLFSLLAWVMVVPAGLALAQRPGVPQPGPVGQPTVNPFPDGLGTIGTGLASIVVTVTDESGNPLDEQALVKLICDETNSNTWGTTQKRSEAEFDSIAPGDYEIEASAAGFQTATQTLNVMSSHEVFNVIVRLKIDSSGNSTAVKPGQLLAPKAAKEAEKGLAGLKSGNLREAQKHLDAAYKLAPTNADINFLLGYLSRQQKDDAQAQAYFERAVSFNPQHVRALTGLAELFFDRKDYKDAIPPLEKAIAADPQQWQSHWLLATAYLHRGEYESARKEAELAIRNGKGAATDAELVLGDALADLGRLPEAVTAYQTFLQYNPQSPLAAAIHGKIASLQNPLNFMVVRDSNPVMSHEGSVPVSPPPPAPPDARLSLPAWGPPNVDDDKPLIASGVACPADQVIERAGQNVKRLVDNLANFDATEDVVQEDVDVLGKPLTKETRKYDYTASISEPQPGVLKVDEFRNGLTDQGGFPGGIATLGLPALAFVFHPDMRPDFDLVCEGLGTWDGQATWLVHFLQRADKPSRMQSFDFTDGSVVVDLKGRAWISASDYQIVRLEADLVRPIQKIRLLDEHQTVEYGPVRFKKKNVQIWLPLQADIYMDFRHQRFHRRHGFSHYMLFSVGTAQKISQPKTPDVSRTE